MALSNTARAWAALAPAMPASWVPTATPSVSGLHLAPWQTSWRFCAMSSSACFAGVSGGGGVLPLPRAGTDMGASWGCCRRQGTQPSAAATVGTVHDWERSQRGLAAVRMAASGPAAALASVLRLA